MNKHVRVHMELNKVFYGGKIISFTLCPFNPQRTSWMDPKTAMDGKKKHYKLRALPV